MIREIWTRRGAAIATLALGALAIVSTAHVGVNVWRVQAAESAAARPKRVSTEPATEWTTPTPMLRAGAGQPKTAVAELLNSQLGELGLTLTSVEVSSARPLGAGLRLAEVRVEAKGDAAAAQAAAEWVSINREAVRMKSISTGLGPQDDPVASMVLLMVIS
jgi:hypothetical protein